MFTRVIHPRYLILKEEVTRISTVVLANLYDLLGLRKLSLKTEYLYKAIFKADF